MAEENGEPLLLEISMELKQQFLINLILTEIESKCHTALALAPSRIAIRLLDGDRIAHSPLRIFTNPTLIELRQEIGQYDWLASPRADDVVLCSRAYTFH
ncbi:hypothetical protein AVEN_5557-1 [Araneus ventricosus]|uniref:Uncharacterized protein n=1 Tax=Araneus ventricosus TaxID=182803 RepID=A0A4Y2DWV5_ARAVE|nr:hypothetical protein AVEN_5557-1 [Araneus ventricosus]